MVVVKCKDWYQEVSTLQVSPQRVSKGQGLVTKWPQFASIHHTLIGLNRNKIANEN